MHTTAHARIDLPALRSNLDLVRVLCPQSRIMAMVKADAYGHGLIPVAKALRSADGLAVARLHEALSLRTAGIESRLLVLATLLDPADLALCSQLHIDVTAHDRNSVAIISRLAGEYPLRVWLKLDSGMHRAGLSPTDFIQADQALSSHRGVIELIHMTHFSAADHSETAATDRQLSCFQRCHGLGSTSQISLANSAALISRPDTHHDWVRPGIMLYGVNPHESQQALPLQAVMSLRSHLIAIREIGPHEHVGYNGRWVSQRNSRIGTIGIGYGDGYPRHAPNGTPIYLNGIHVPLIGQVSMDSLTVDLTGCPSASIGDEVELWGRNVSAVTVARMADTIPYELFTAIQQRVSREYVGQ